MKRLALLATSLLAATGLAFGGVSHARAATLASCEQFDYVLNHTARPGYTGADWECNSADELLQVKSVCTNGRGSAGSFLSGKTALLETAIRATCSSTLPLLETGWWRFSGDGGMTWSPWTRLGSAPSGTVQAARQGVDVSITDPGITQELIGTKSLIHLHMTETTFTVPRRFTMLMTFYVWPAIGNNPQVYQRCGPDFSGNCVFTKTKADLAPAGKSKPWDFYPQCDLGRFYMKVVVGGISSTGLRVHLTVFYPAGTDSNGNRDPKIRPTRKQSHLITTCPHP